MSAQHTPREAFRSSIQPILEFELLFRLLGLALAGPVTAWLLRSLAGLGTDFSLSNAQILEFLLSPRGLLTLVVALPLVVVGVFLEQAGLNLIGGAALHGGRLRALDALRRVVALAPSILSLCVAQLAILALWLLPFALMLGVCYAWLLSSHDINFYLAQRPPEFKIAIAVAALTACAAALVGARLFVRFAFSLHVCLFEGATFFTALWQSDKLVAGNGWRVAKMLLGWILVAFVLSSALLAFFTWLAGAVVDSLPPRLGLLVMVVGTSVVLLTVLAVVLTTAGMTVYALIATRMYLNIRDERGLAPLSQTALLPAGSALARSRWWPRARWLWAGVVAILALSTVSSLLAIEQLDLRRPVAVTAHRGSSAAAPENTLAAIRQAIVDGADYAEIDVQETKDGRVVLLHDTDLMKVAGVARNVWDLTATELRDIDAGSWKSAEFAAEYVPTLEEAIDVAHGHIKLNIELKLNGHEQALVERVVAILRERNVATKDAILMSLEYDAVQKAKQLAPERAVGYLVAAALGDLTRLDVDFLALSTSAVNAGVVRDAHAAGLGVHVWTVNTQKAMLNMFILEVDNLITDYPADARALLRERDKLSDIELVLIELRRQFM